MTEPNRPVEQDYWQTINSVTVVTYKRAQDDYVSAQCWSDTDLDDVWGWMSLHQQSFSTVLHTAELSLSRLKVARQLLHSQDSNYITATLTSWQTQLLSNINTIHNSLSAWRVAVWESSPSLLLDTECGQTLQAMSQDVFIRAVRPRCTVQLWLHNIEILCHHPHSHSK